MSYTKPLRSKKSFLISEDSALDDIAISDDSDHAAEEGCGLQVLNRYSKV